MTDIRYLVSDWDGTAVTSREPSAARDLVGPLEAVLELGVVVYIVTGTKHDWAARQLRSLRPDLAASTFVCCNRGSEVYRLGPGAPEAIHQRVMTNDEREAINRVSDAIVGPLLAQGLQVSTVTDRLNRIKIDLVPEWTDPPKQRIGEVVDLVNERFVDSGGLGGLLDLTGSLVASEHADLRVTSDGKHIEIGITDKSDSMAWVLADIAQRGGSIDELMIVGDEFGPIGGAEGSDAKTAISGAAVYSVGPEPAGVPDGVEHLGGGPARFIELLGTVRKSA